MCDSWYISLSGGKDSTVVRDIAGDVPCVFSDDEWWLPETEAYIRRLQVAGVNVHWIRTTTHHTEWFVTEGDWLSIPDYAASQGWKGVFIGMRKDENSQRHLHLCHFGPLFYAQKYGVWHCNPIADWSVTDVWAYIVSRGLDYNRAYDKLMGMGIPLERQRIGPLATRRALGHGQLSILKAGWPDLFNRFAAVYPEARAYV